MNELSNPGRSFFDGNPKTLFYFGIVCGVAATLLLNSFMGLSYGVGGTGDAGAKVAASPSASPSTGPQDPRLYTTGKMPEVTATDHVRGDLNKAKVVIVEYSDLQCPFCSRHHPTLKKIFDTYGGDTVAWVYRHFPLTSIHPNAVPAALASECASEQGKFWEFTDALFADNTSVNGDTKTAEAFYQKVAKDLKLNTTKFTECIESKKYQSIVDEQMAGAQALQVQGTPATFINGQMVQVFDTRSGAWGSAGAASYAVIQKFVDAEIAKKK